MLRLVQSNLPPGRVLLFAYLGLMALVITASMGFILMLKQRADEENRSLAMIDALTGIFNRRAFVQRARTECAIAQRNNLPLALLMIDVDHFKAINDRYGHPVGDEVLVRMAQMLGSRLRKQDTLARFGGEEFCALLPGTDEAGALSIAETLRAAIASNVLAHLNPPVFVTISIGVTVRPPSNAAFDEDFDCLLSAADAALYQAKHDGRDRAVLLNSLRRNPHLHRPVA